MIPFGHSFTTRRAVARRAYSGSMHSGPCRRLGVWILCVLACAALALAQEQPPAAPEAVQAAPAAIDAPSIAQVQERIAQVEADTTLEPAQKDATLAALRTALESLQRRDTARTETQQFLDSATSAAGTLEQLRAELDTPVTLPVVAADEALPPDAALEAIRAQLADAKARFDAAKDEQARLQADASTREKRLADAPASLVRWREELAEATGSLAALPPDPPDPAATARRWQLQAHAAELAANIARLEAEVASYTARKDVLPLRQSLAQRRADTAARLLEQLRAVETTLNDRKARLAREQADQQAAQLALPALRDLAQRTSELAAQRIGPQGTLSRLEAVRARHARAGQLLDDLQRRARNTAARVEAAGLTEAVGQFLRTELVRLPEPDPQALDRLSRDIGEAQFQLIGVEEELDAYADVQAAIARLRERLTKDAAPLPPAQESQLVSVVTAHAETLTALRDEYGGYITEASALDATLRTLDQTSDAFRDFIEERILWTRSVRGRSMPSPDDLRRGAAWLLGATEADPAQAPPEPVGTQWAKAARELWPPPLGTVPLILALAASLWARRWARRVLVSTAARVRRFGTDRLGLTLEALPLTVLMALPLPIALALAGVLLGHAQPAVAQAVGSALLEGAWLAFGLEFVRQAARPDGLAEAHFRWRREGLTHLRRALLVLVAFMLPLMVVARTMDQHPDQAIGDGLGRVAFVGAQLAKAVFYAWAFAPWRAFVGVYLSRHSTGVANQSRWLWYPLLAAGPLALAVLSAMGYHYTATQLGGRLTLTAWLLVGFALIYSLVLRWLFIERRKLLLARAHQKREAEKAEQPTGGGEVEGIELDTQRELDAADIDAQTRRVLTAGLLVGVALGVYWLWTNQLPALRMLDRVQVWPVVDFLESGPATIDAPGLNAEPTAPAQVSTTEPPVASTGPLVPGGPTQASASEPIGALTLSDIGAALILFSLTWIVARNLPGILEITLLKRLPLDSGARFAVTSILRYVIGVIGILLAFGALGIGWSQVQFLAAALTFGLAFGLQEIFANFISGLIILVERPVRVGDTVTVNGIDGRVTRIRTRATTVLDWELRELIIPNKVFITDQFINWTLSDPRIRLTIPVGVAYGSDVRLVQKTLLEIGQAQEHIAAEPKPRVVFLAFGDSTLNFELRVYLEHFDYFLDARTDLHTRIAERFAELGIEIAFPQRDVHLQGLGPLADAIAGRRPDATPG